MALSQRGIGWDGGFHSRAPLRVHSMWGCPRSRRGPDRQMPGSRLSLPFRCAPYGLTDDPQGPAGTAGATEDSCAELDPGM